MKKERNIPLTKPVRIWVKEFIEVPAKPYSATPDRFVRELSNVDLASNLIFNNFVNLAVPAQKTQAEGIREFASKGMKPFQIDSLPHCFDEKIFIRGCSYLGHVWREVDEIAMNWPNMRWWYSERGLGMAILTDKELEAKIRLRRLEPFDDLAGRRVAEALKSGRVSDQAVVEICKSLDAAELQLKNCLSAASWKTIAHFNQKFSKRPITSFEAAFAQFPRQIRRRLYQAKDRYLKAKNA